MRRLKMMHYYQDPAHCAVASCACVANYYDSKIDYEYTKKIAYSKISKKVIDEGLDSGEICLLLNKLGFNKVILVSSVFDVFDYEWEDYGKKKMLYNLEESMKKKKNKEERNETKSIYKWYKQKEYRNKIIIDYNFGKYIRKYLNKRKPVIITFNWTMLFKFPKEDEKGNTDIANGIPQEHAVVANGYDEKGVWIVDSHHKYYKYKRKKYRRGFYKISWENLMTTIGEGDVIFPDNYNN